jgi:hypothetical protein
LLCLLTQKIRRCGRTIMATKPTFFFSHARQDRELSRNNYLDKFYVDLEARVASLAGVDLKRGGPIGTIDREILQGADWDRVLSRALSDNKAFVSLFSPTYFGRENCGIEIYVFVLRSKDIGIDSNGALTGIENFIPIRWEIKEAYYDNTESNSRVPIFLSLLSDQPASSSRDPVRAEAIKFYYEKGMQRCVASEPHYSELLDCFALRILSFNDLPPGSGVRFADAQDAFKYDWKNHLTKAGTTAVSVPLPGPSQQVVPRPLSSVVAFYITRRSFTPDQTPVDFADQLIAEPLPGSSTTADATFTSLLTVVRAACIMEGLNVFHAAANPVVPVSAKPLLERLVALTAKKVLPCLIIDSNVWPYGDEADATVIEEIIQWGDWIGPVLIAPVGDTPLDPDGVAGKRKLPAETVHLPRSRDTQVAVLRRAFIDVRGRTLSGSAEKSLAAERVPWLKGVGADYPDDKDKRR